MKKIYVLLTLVFAGSQVAFAQAPTITSANNFNINEVNVQYVADSTGVLPGSAGANVTWDFSNLQRISTGDSVLSKFQSVASTPYPNDFPRADLASASVSGQNYVYLTYKNNTYTIVGEEGTQTANGQTVTIKQIFDKPEVLYTFPLTYNTSQNGTYAAHYDVQGTTAYRNGATSLNCDGYGTLKIMNKTFSNVLRIHNLSQEIDSFVGIPFTIIYDIESWSYLMPGKKDNILTISYTTVDEAGSIQSVKSVTYNTNSYTLGVDEASADEYGMSLYPNPAKQNSILAFSSNIDTRANIQVVNQLGQTVKNLNDVAIRKGSNNIELSLAGLTNGVYFVRMNAGNNMLVQKLAVE